jgi:hypothetical protein
MVLSGLYLIDHGVTLFEVRLSPCCLQRKDQRTWASVILVGSAIDGDSDDSSDDELDDGGFLR